MWCDRPRPGILGWPPRSAWGLVLLVLGLSAALMATGIAAVAWRDATGMGSRLGPGLLVFGAIAGLVVTWQLVLVALVTRPVHYALAKDELGRLHGYAIDARRAVRFPVLRAPEVAEGSTSERGELDWGELEVEDLTTGAPYPMRMRWSHVAYPHVVIELAGAGQ